MRFRIRTAARQDILNQFTYLLEEDSPEAANRFLISIERAIGRLCQHPAIGTLKKFKNPRLQGLRRWPVDGFEAIGIYYLLLASENILQVVRVLHGKRDIERIFG